MDTRPSQSGLFPRLADCIWRAPLVPVALCLTLGILLDRRFSIPLYFSYGAALACVLAWMINLRSAAPGVPLLYLWAGCAALGAAYHHTARDEIAVNDI